MIDKNSPVSLQKQLVDLLKHFIEDHYEPNHKLMSERDICMKYDISRTTVRLALQELENLGYIYRVHGKGSFIAERQEPKKDLADSYSFTENMRALNKKPETKILSFKKMTVPAIVADNMEIGDSDQVYYLERVRLADGLPMMYEESYLPESLFPGLNLGLLKSKPLYDVFRDEYGIAIDHAQEELTASILTDEEADLLDQECGGSCLKIKRMTYDPQGRIIEHTYSLARSDQFTYKVTLNE